MITLLAAALLGQKQVATAPLSAYLVGFESLAPSELVKIGSEWVDRKGKHQASLIIREDGGVTYATTGKGDAFTLKEREIRSLVDSIASSDFARYRRNIIRAAGKPVARTGVDYVLTARTKKGFETFTNVRFSLAGRPGVFGVIGNLMRGHRVDLPF